MGKTFTYARRPRVGDVVRVFADGNPFHGRLGVVAVVDEETVVGLRFHAVDFDKPRRCRVAVVETSMRLVEGEV